MLQPGKMMEIADEVLKLGIDGKAKGRLIKKKFTVMYSGPENQTGQYGTGFIISRKIKESILECEPVDRLCRNRIRGEIQEFDNNLSPRSHRRQRRRGKQNSAVSLKEHELIVIMWDFNAKVGREESRHKISDKYSLHEHSNENGSLLVQSAIRNNFYIKSTTFPHKTIHMGTWKIPGSTEVNQIYCVLVSARHASFITDVRSSKGANCDSDHYLVKAK